MKKNVTIGLCLGQMFPNARTCFAWFFPISYWFRIRTGQYAEAQRALGHGLLVNPTVGRRTVVRWERWLQNRKRSALGLLRIRNIESHESPTTSDAYLEPIALLLCILDLLSEFHDQLKKMTYMLSNISKERGSGKWEVGSTRC